MLLFYTRLLVFFTPRVILSHLNSQMFSWELTFAQTSDRIPELHASLAGCASLKDRGGVSNMYYI